MNTFQLECFLAVANFLNFAKAAEQMNVTQPSITRQIKSLENELKVELFHRTTRSVELTAVGRIFLDDARNIVLLSKRAAGRFEHPDEQPVLDFSIGCYGYAGLQSLPAVLQKLSSKYPNLHPNIRAFPDFSLLERVKEGSLDVALAFQGAEKEKNSLHFRELKKVSWICVLKADHPLTELKSIDADHLADYPIILQTPVHAMTNVTQMQWLLTNTRSPSELHLCESPEAALLLVEAGIGIAILPDIVYSFERLSLAAIPLAGIEPISWGVYHKRGTSNPLAKDFVRFMQEIQYVEG